MNELFVTIVGFALIGFIAVTLYKISKDLKEDRLNYFFKYRHS